MSIFKCKMCGGALEIENDKTVGVCEYCGTQQTLPKLDNDRRANLYDRANHLRRNNEFDKAMGIYEQLLNEDTTDSEAYWSLVLCRYGIEYVEDPSSHKRIPTINRAQFTSIFDDDNYKSALQYSDNYQRNVYEEEAKTINEIQKGILAISQKEEPFDVFICYKESDNNGRRTPDSVLANDLYHQLSQEGFKVFFARITLEDKLGTAYEPYIFAALNSAKVMVVLGTKSEYFNAVWVKNEWSRYLSLIKQGEKKILIPAYKDMDPYDLPEEFSHLQAQDMGKLGFMQDLIRGIKKITQTDTPTSTIVKETVVTGGNTSVESLLKRAFMFLEDGEWDSANEYCEKVLDIDPECAEAYLGKLMVELNVRKQDELKNYDIPFDYSKNYTKAVRYANEELKSALEAYLDNIFAGIYNRAKNAMSSAKTEGAYKEVAKLFGPISDYLDSASLAKQCLERAANEKERLNKKKDEYLQNRHKAQKDCQNAEDDFKKALDNALKNKFDIFNCEKHTKIENLRKKKKEAETTLASLGIFKIGEKREMKAEIERLEEEIQLVSSQSYSREEIEVMSGKMLKAQKEYSAALKVYINERFPCDPINTPEYSDEYCKFQIIKAMTFGVKYSCADIRKAAGDPICDYAAVSATKLEALLDSLVFDSKCMCSEFINKVHYFELNEKGLKLSGELDWMDKEKKPDYNENTNVVFPKAPDVENILN